MPQKTETISVAGYENNIIQAIAFGTLEQLEWKLKYAGDDKLTAYTHTEWRKQAEEIYIETSAGQLTVTSKMIHNESFDISGKNKRNIGKFLSAFEATKNTSTEQQQSQWRETLVPVKQETMQAAEKEARDAEEVDRVMNLSKSNLFITYAIIVINVLVFIIMVISGISLLAPTGLDILKWGANFLPLTATGEWWRLLSCVFVHIGIIHLLFNMYAFYMVGVYLEPMLGKARFIVAYLCTGIFASLASLWWHNDPVPSAGASGAIFGMYGVFLALLSTSLIPKQVRDSLLKSIGIFVLYNLAYGMKSGVDNAAHIGGLLSGLIIGYIFYLMIKKKETPLQTIFIPTAIVAVTLAISFAYLRAEGKKIDPFKKQQIDNAIHSAGNIDEEKFIGRYGEFLRREDTALAPLNDTTLSNEQFSEKLRTVSQPQWEKAQQLVDEVKDYELADVYREKVKFMQQYVIQRKEEIRILLKLINENNEANLRELKSIRDLIDNTVKELDK